MLKPAMTKPDLVATVTTQLVELGVAQDHIDTIIRTPRAFAVVASLLELRDTEPERFETLTNLLWGFIGLSDEGRAKFLDHIGLVTSESAMQGVA